MLQNLKCFERLCEATRAKFHIWPHVIGHIQKAGTLKLLYKITFISDYEYVEYMKHQ
jgi:hypothetical protein